MRGGARLDDAGADPDGLTRRSWTAPSVIEMADRPIGDWPPCYFVWSLNDLTSLLARYVPASGPAGVKVAVRG